jgi:hypothetical protein
MGSKYPFRIFICYVLFLLFSRMAMIQFWLIYAALEALSTTKLMQKGYIIYSNVFTLRHPNNIHCDAREGP